MGKINFYVPCKRMLNKRLGCSKFSTPRERIRAVAGVFILVIILILLFFFFFRSCEEKKLIKQGNEIIQKIELYRLQKGHLPSRLTDVGIDEKMEETFFYLQWDSINYMLYFSTIGVGESMNYYSDTKEWDYRLRGMGNVPNDDNVPKEGNVPKELVE